MIFKRLAIIALIAVCSLSFSACIPFFGDVGSAPDVFPVEDAVDSTENKPAAISFSKSSYSTVHIVDFGTVPSSKTLTFDFGFDTITLKSKGYTTLDFKLEFSVYIDDGIKVSSVVSAYFKDNDKSEFGVGWGNMKFTNTNPNTVSYNKSIRIESLLQKRGNIYLTFDAVDNTLFTGTYISNIELTVTAK